MNATLPVLTLKAGREDSVLRRHPWVFSGAVATVTGTPQAGDTVQVRDAKGRVLGSAAWSPMSQIRARMWHFDEQQRVDEEFFHARIAAALASRAALAEDASTNALRLIASEADGLPGVILDRYGSVLVFQFLSAGAERWRDVMIRIVAGLIPDATYFERSDGEARQKEGLPARTGSLGIKDLEIPCVALEAGLRFLLRPDTGHKTGFYLDQRENRRLLGSMAAGADVLNCFSYTGGFAVHALAGGATHVTDVEVSGDALTLARLNVERNGFDTARYRQEEADVFAFLRHCRDDRRSFDIIVLDPPKFAASKSQIERAARGYKDINLLAMKLLRPGGLLFTFSCSGHMSQPLFQKIVSDAAVDARRDARIRRFLTQAADHPIALAIPESWYLKGLICGLD
ncbi:MAG: class I SAM-dependent methyltransferase [Bacteroidota bacterium]|jgi:23S rRNA (cytosine1962-C5)-methyltransferase|nr:class I SAM-dependent methyltransferase [Bacteroidota bacterium]